MRKKIILGIIIAMLSVATVAVAFSSTNEDEDVQQNEQTAQESAVAKKSGDLPEGISKEYVVQKGDTFAEIMLRQGVAYGEVSSIIDSAKDVFDLTKVSAGRLIRLVFVNEALAAVEYQANSDTLIHVKKESDKYVATEENIEYEITPTAARGMIDGSLFSAAKDAGVEDKVILQLADVFSWDIDFATDIREGDSFSLVYEKRSLGGKPAGAGKLLAAKFINNGVSYSAYRYDDTYYDPDGKELSRQFLKSPLSYSSISSGYSNYRVNPITRKVETHLAIDYAAPAGTPIIATGKGEISYAATKGGLGITVEIKHGGSYQTQYAHMSRIAKGIKKGVTVDQGQVIGYVGSTGLSTGPHLQYMMTKGKTKVNPLSQQFAKGESLSKAKMEEFNRAKESLDSRLKND